MNAYELGKLLVKQAAVKSCDFRGGVRGGALGGLGGLLGGAGYGAVESAFADPEDGRNKEVLNNILHRALLGAAIGTGSGAMLGGFRHRGLSRDEENKLKDFVNSKFNNYTNGLMDNNFHDYAGDYVSKQLND